METERPYQLTRDLAELTDLLESNLSSCRAAGRQEDILDTFLLAAGISQVVDDYRHRDLPLVTKAAARFERRGSAPGRFVSRSATAMNAGAIRFRDRSIEGRLRPLRESLGAAIGRLADAVVCGAQPDMSGLDARSLIRRLRTAPRGLRASVMVLPQCFFSFDMKPEDLGSLVDEFSRRWPERSRSIGVVGIRTSGSYLSPLVAAYLRRAGYRCVDEMTWRPRQPWLAAERRTLRRIRRNRGLVLLADDPPTSGTTFAGAAASLERNGVQRPSIILLLQLFDSPAWWTWPSQLAAYQQVQLTYPRWHVHQLLSESSIGSSLKRLGHGEAGPATPLKEFTEMRRLAMNKPPDGAVPVRTHVRARFEVHFGSGNQSKPAVRGVLAQGVGLGYFGRAALETAQRLEGLSPTTHGLEDGLLFRDWVPEDRYSAPTYRDPSASEALARYVSSRAERLSVPDDLSRRVAGRDAMWQRCSNLLSPAFGSLAPVARLALQGAFKRLMRPSHPSLIDGHMERSHWLSPNRHPTARQYRKLDIEAGAYWSGISYCSDPTYDLAAAAADREAALGDTLDEVEPSPRDVFLKLGGACSDERWLLNQLLYLQSLRTYRVDAQQVYERAHATIAGTASSSAYSHDEAVPSVSLLLDALGPSERQMSRLLTRYLAKAFPSGATLNADGPVCAIDIDGVLETASLGFPATSPVGVMALRALQAHGYQVVLASGRSSGEVRERCQAYGLRGGVAEYGAVIFSSASNRDRVLLTELQRADLATISEALLKLDGVYIDPSCRASVRAYRVEYGSRRGLDWPTITLALSKAGPDKVVAIQGRAQTDFIAAGTDKGAGVLELLGELGVTAPADGRVAANRPLALAVGDTLSDWPMLRLARRAFALGNLADALRKSTPKESTVRPLTGRHQVGLRQAVSHLLGHRPGTCAICLPPAASKEALDLLTILGVQNQSWPAALRAILRLRREGWS